MDKEIVLDALDVIRSEDSKDLCRIPVAGEYILNNNEIIARQFEYETISAKRIAEQLAAMRGMVLNE